MSLFNKKKQDSKNPTENTEQTSPIRQLEDILRKNKVQGITILSDPKGACYFMGGEVKAIIVEVCTAMELDHNFAMIIRTALDLYDSFQEDKDKDKNVKSDAEETSRSSEE